MQQFCPFPDPVITYSVQDDAQWKDKWKDSFHPFRVTDDLIVTPVWEPTPEIANENDTILLIEPGSAFGTGTHETTRLCMTSLRSYIHKDTRIMVPAGGSGILAIAALLYGCEKCILSRSLIHLQSPEHWKSRAKSHCRRQDPCDPWQYFGDQCAIKAECPEPI